MKKAREKQLITYWGTLTRVTVELSLETIEPEGSGMTHSNYWKKKLSNRILYSGKLSFKTEGIIKPFSGKHNLIESVTSKFALQEILKGILQAKMKRN